MTQQQDVQMASLGDALDRVYGALVGMSPDGIAGEDRARSLPLNEPCFALHRLESVFALSPFERDVVLLCAGASLETRFLSACAAEHHDPAATWPTFGLALSVLDEPHWSAISRSRPTERSIAPRPRFSTPTAAPLPASAGIRPPRPISRPRDDYRAAAINLRPRGGSQAMIGFADARRGMTVVA